MDIHIRVFGQITDITGKAGWKQSGINNIAELNQQLIHEFPELKTIKYSIAVNQKVIHENINLSDGDTVALLPPFSGG